MTFKITHEHDGRLLRSYLKLTLGLSTATLSKLKNHPSGIVVNGQRVTVLYVLHTGDILELAVDDTPDTATRTVIPTDLPLDVLYEDDHVLALNKPPFMPTHPSHGHLTDTLANALSWRYHTEGKPFVFRPLGRLDRNTSGVVVVGKSRAASGALGNALLSGKVQKYYIAILQGLPNVEKLCLCHKEKSPMGDILTLETHMHRVDGCGIRREVCSPQASGAERAVTRFCVLATSQDKNLTLVLAQPITGRTHQLRVHFTYLNAPILGDDIYGEVSPLIARHALHALSISAPLPFAMYDNAIPNSSDTLDTTPLFSYRNQVDKQGILHTYAPIPKDMGNIIKEAFSSFKNDFLF